ncbi:MAG: hypothetical protein M1839_003850 [Geoglossum umbratile]|nr:MAG: hypothetical protein M1839_003850 [Geoglossum umbratile]
MRYFENGNRHLIYSAGELLKPTNNPIECPRRVTLAALWELIQQVGVVYVRGTPASGKSILSLLLKEYVKEKTPNLLVLRTSWHRMIDLNLPKNTEYYELLNEAFKAHRREDWRNLQALIIIDEAQATYAYSSLGADLIKITTPGSDLKIALFASYGSPRDTPFDISDAAIAAPMNLNPNQRISIRRSSRNPDLGLFFSYTEFEDVVARVCEFHARPGASLLSPETVEYIWEITNGHPAGVQVTLRTLANSEIVRPFRKGSIEIPTNISLNYLQSNHFLITMIQDAVFKRGLPAKDFLKDYPDIAKLFREVLTSGRSEHDPEKYPSLATCYKQGWLQAELDEPQNPGDPDPKPVYIFSSELHRRCVEHMLSIQAPPFPLDKFTCVRELCLATIRQFKSTALRSEQRGLGTGAVPRPVEGRYQDEFYRACVALLGEVYISSAWSGAGSRGRVDFLVGLQRWAIECTRDGDRLNEHISKFQEGGQYYDRIQNGDIGQYIVLDFRTSQPKKIRDVQKQRSLNTQSIAAQQQCKEPFSVLAGRSADTLNVMVDVAAPPQLLLSDLRGEAA